MILGRVGQRFKVRDQGIYLSRVHFRSVLFFNTVVHDVNKLLGHTQLTGKVERRACATFVPCTTILQVPEIALRSRTQAHTTQHQVARATSDSSIPSRGCFLKKFSTSCARSPFTIVNFQAKDVIQWP